MSIYDFFLLLDEYIFDANCYYLSVKSQKFAQISYQKWSVEQIKNEVALSIYPKEYATKDELTAIISGFANRMANYSYRNEKSKIIFVTAQDVATDILDIIK